MAIAYEAAVSTDVTYPSGAGTVSTAIATAGSDRFLAAAGGFRQSAGHTITGMTYNAIATTALGVAVIGTQAYIRGFGLVTPATGSNTLQATGASGAGTIDGILSAMAWSGVDQSTPYDGYTSNTGTGTPGTLAVSSAVGDVAFWFAGARSATGFTETGYTERFDNTAGAGGTSYGMTGGDAAGAATVNFSSAFAGGPVNGWATLGANLNVASGGGGSSVKRLIGGNLINRSILFGRLAA